MMDNIKDKFPKNDDAMRVLLYLSKVTTKNAAKLSTEQQEEVDKYKHTKGHWITLTHSKAEKMAFFGYATFSKYSFKKVNGMLNTLQEMGFILLDKRIRNRAYICPEQHRPLVVSINPAIKLQISTRDMRIVKKLDKIGRKFLERDNIGNSPRADAAQRLASYISDINWEVDEAPTPKTRDDYSNLFDEVGTIDTSTAPDTIEELKTLTEDSIKNKKRETIKDLDAQINALDHDSDDGIKILIPLLVKKKKLERSFRNT